MKIIIEIDTSGAGFDVTPTIELRRVLNTVPTKGVSAKASAHDVARSLRGSRTSGFFPLLLDPCVRDRSL